MHYTIALITKQARPILRITGVRRRDWCRNTQDKRRGPWRYEALYDVLDAEEWNRRSAVLYLVNDGAGKLRMVGESSGRLKDRWRISPMHDVSTMETIGRGLFHSTAWPALEAAFDAERPPFTISAIFGNDLTRVAEQLRGSGVALPEGRHLGHAIEQAILRSMGPGSSLWNRKDVA